MFYVDELEICIHILEHLSIHVYRSCPIQMKKRGLKVQPVAYTGLFNACAHSPWPTTDGLQRAKHLRTELIGKRYMFNQIISHAMIKGVYCW